MQGIISSNRRKPIAKIICTVKTLALAFVISLCSVVFTVSVFAQQPVPKKLTAAEYSKATYVGTETCATCHEKEYKEYKLSTHARIDIKGDDKSANGCEMCHGPGSIHVDNEGGKGTIINPRKNPEVCFNCHSDKKLEFRLPYHHPVLEGKMGCVDCHDAHGEDVRPWTATSENGANETCFKCHAEKRGPFVYEHEALKDGCTVCHKVHGSVNDKMLLARDATLCLRCHGQIDFPNVGGQNHTSSRLKQGTCFSGGCHEAVHGSNFSDTFRN